MLSSKRSLLAWAVASLAFILPQASAQCNPLTSTCPPNPGLTKNDFSVDFTKVSSLPEGWTLANYATVKYGANGAEFTFNKRFEAPYIWTSFYILFGRVEVVMQAAPGTGMISSAVLMSDDQDEIDWEWSGNNFGHQSGKVQTNYFGKGITGYWDRGTQPDMDDPINKFHTYTIDWSPTILTWAIDGQVIRTLKAADTNNGAYQYPQSPSKFHLGLWCAGDPNSHPNTVSWAGGYTDFTKAPFTAYVKSVKISNANPCSQYEYGDNSGSWRSIKCLNATSTSTSSSSIASTSSSTSSPLSSLTSATSRSSSLLSSISSIASSSSSSLSSSVSSVASSSSSSLSSAVSSIVSSRPSSPASSSTSASIPASSSASPAASPSYPNSGPVFDPLHPDPALINKTGPGTFNYTFKSLSSLSSSGTLTSKSSGSSTQGLVSSSTANPLPSSSSPSPAPIKPTTSTSPPPNQEPSKQVPTASPPTTTPTSNKPTPPIVPSTTPVAKPTLTTSPSTSPSSPKPTTTATSSKTAAPPSTPPKCNQDNCLRALQNTRYASSATAFCKSFTNTGSANPTATPTPTIAATNGIIQTPNTSTTPNPTKTAPTPAPTPTSSTTLAIPTWLSGGCSNNTTRVSSACACLNPYTVMTSGASATTPTGIVAAGIKAGVGTVEGVRKVMMRAGFGAHDDDDDDGNGGDDDGDDDDDDDNGGRDGRGRWRWSGNAKFGSRYVKAKAKADAKAKAKSKSYSEKGKEKGKDADKHQNGWLYRRRAGGWAGLIG